MERLSQALEQDKRQVTELEVELTQYKCVEGRLDLIDDAIFGGLPKTNDEEKDMHRQFHVLHEIVRRLDASVQLETRAQKHLDKALSLCTMLIKELLKGLNIGIKIGVPTNTKHKTQLWSGTSPTHSARTSRGLVLRAKTICGDLHTNYIQARAVQRRVGILPPLEVIAPNRLPGMKTKNVVDELVSAKATFGRADAGFGGFLRMFLSDRFLRRLPFPSDSHRAFTDRSSSHTLRQKLPRRT